MTESPDDKDRAGGDARRSGRDRAGRDHDGPRDRNSRRDPGESTRSRRGAGTASGRGHLPRERDVDGGWAADARKKQHRDTGENYRGRGERDYRGQRDDRAGRGGWGFGGPRRDRDDRGYQGQRGDRGYRGQRDDRDFRGQRDDRDFRGQRDDRDFRGQRDEGGHRGFGGPRRDRNDRGYQGQRGDRGYRGQRDDRDFRGQRDEGGGRGFGGPRRDRDSRGYQGSRDDRGYRGQRDSRGYQGSRGDRDYGGQRDDRGYRGRRGDRDFRGQRDDGGGRGFGGPRRDRDSRGYQGSRDDRGYRGQRGDRDFRGQRDDGGGRGFGGPRRDRDSRGYQGSRDDRGYRGQRDGRDFRGQRDDREYRGSRGSRGSSDQRYEGSRGERPQDHRTHERGRSTGPRESSGREPSQHGDQPRQWAANLADSFGLPAAGPADATTAESHEAPSHDRRPPQEMYRGRPDHRRDRHPRDDFRRGRNAEGRYADRSDRGHHRGDDDDWPVREKPTGSRVRKEDVDETWPEIPEDTDLRELPSDVRADLRGLSKQGADFVGAHLVLASELVDDDPELAWRHARAARAQGGRLAVVRETVGLVAYRAGQWSEAITELRAARRMAGGPGLIAVMADAERALGQPERAIELSKSAEAQQLDPSSAAELAIVVAGARADLGQSAAALAALASLSRSVNPEEPHAHRVYYAYAALLEQEGKTSEAQAYFVKAADADPDDQTDAAERAAELAESSSGSEPTDE